MRLNVLLRTGLLLGFTAMFLQIAVFLQPLLPKQFQVASVCETITQVLIVSKSSMHDMSHASMSEVHQHNDGLVSSTTGEHEHDSLNHQCQYCTVYGHLILPPELEVKEILVRIQIRLLAFQRTFRHIYFELQRLFLLPQGRAPPVFA